MTILEWHLEKMVSSIELPEPNLPKWNCNFDGSPEICANYIREFWKVPRGRIENLTKLIEDNGIVVIPLDLGKLDGLSVFTQSGIPVIFVNKSSICDISPRLRYKSQNEPAIISPSA